MSLFAEVIVSISHHNIDKPFNYIIPGTLEEIVKPGMRVFVPFGNGNKKIEAYVTGITEQCDIPQDKMKAIISVLDTYAIMSGEMLKLTEWMHKKYYTTMADCIHCVMPAGIRLIGNGDIPVFKDYSRKIKMVSLNDDNEDLDDMISEIVSKPSKQSDVLQLVISCGQISVNDIKAYMRITDAPISSLVKKGILVIEQVNIPRNIYEPEKYSKTEPPVLTAEQSSAVEKICGIIENGDKKPILLHGITGSGKTEVYMRIIERVISEGKQAIVLVPEISLTPQAVEVFMRRFGASVTITHSRLSLGERFDQWKKAREGSVSIMIGPRSAVFAPFSKLGAIIIDEEHEKTYKSETPPKYDARAIAEKRAELTGCVVIFGSATPSIETYHRAVEEKSIHLITLSERVNKKWPETCIVDMRKELADGNKSIFSNGLYEAIAENIKNKQQSILFLNRRGHSTFVSCRRCGYVLECEECSVNYTYHVYNDKLICHYCGKSIGTPENCPICGSKHIRYFGVGTQKIEEEIKQYFPDAKVLRMDMDTTTRKNSHEKIINEFAEGNVDILIGTQMIAKGLNFPNVSLVGIIAADIALNAGDFGSAETAYQLITQVSGRAGRAELDGTVYIQTYMPEHYSIQFAKESDYAKFYNHEIEIRRQMQYPPFTHIFVILFTGTDEKKIIQSLYRLLDVMNAYNRKGKLEMLGPAPAVISKIRKNFRWKLLIKGKEEEIIKMFVFYCLEKLKKDNDLSGIRISLSLDPPVIQ